MEMVLIVDDTPDNLDILKGILRQNYKVKAAISGAKALEIAGSDQVPDIILLDIMMPEMDGFEVCRRLKQNGKTKHIPVIFITALGDFENETKGLELGAVDYITKPFNPTVVEARIKTQIELVKQRKSVERLLSNTLVGSIKIMTDLLHSLNKHASVISNRMRSEMMRVVRRTTRKELWRFEIAASLSHIGCVLIDPTIQRKYSLGLLLSEKERAEYETYLLFGATLLQNIPRLEDICIMLQGQTHVLTREEMDTPLSELSDFLFGAQLLRTISAFQYYRIMLESIDLVLGRLKRENHHSGIIKLILEDEEKHLDVPAKKESIDEEEQSVIMTVDQLKEGMVIAHNCKTTWGMVIVPAGVELGNAQLKMLKNFCEKGKRENSFIVI